MCDPFTAGSTVLTSMGARNEAALATDIQSRGDFEAAMLSSASVLASAKAQGDEVQVRDQLGQMYRTNVAAAILSGVDNVSFDSINNAQQKEGSKAIEQIYDNVNFEKAGLRTQAVLTLTNAKVDAANHAAAAYTGALGTILGTAQAGYQNYKDNRVEEINPKKKSGLSKKFSSFFKMFTGKK
jgi:hypothetical protein